MKYFSILIFLSFSVAVFGQKKSDSDKMRNIDSLINSYQKYGLNDTLLNNKETAIAVAEAILFNIYGKKQIESEKPYDVKYKNGCWFISGTLKEDELGGVFSIVLNAKDGKAVVFPHGK